MINVDRLLSMSELMMKYIFTQGTELDDDVLCDVE